MSVLITRVKPKCYRLSAAFFDNFKIFLRELTTVLLSYPNLVFMKYDLWLRSLRRRLIRQLGRKGFSLDTKND